MRQVLLCFSLVFSNIQCKLSRLPQADIVRGQGFAAPPPGHLLEAEVGPGPRPPRHSRPAGHQEHRRKPIKVISEFDAPNSFQPMKNYYSKERYEPTTEPSFVSGPPLGDDFVERYQKMIRNSQKKSQLSFSGLLPEDLIDRRKRKHQDPVPAFYQIKSPVTLDFPSASFESFDFNPNGGWFGEKETGLATAYPNHLVPKRQTAPLSRPSSSLSSQENFSPSGWKVYRDRVVETGTRNSVYSSEDEPAVITLDNVADYLHRPGGRDVFDVNVQAVIKTRDAPNASKQFYLNV